MQAIGTVLVKLGGMTMSGVIVALLAGSVGGMATAKLSMTAPGGSRPREPSRKAGGDLELDGNLASRSVQLSALQRLFLTIARFELWPGDISRIHLGHQIVVRATVIESQD
jgi:hypothetical protein